MNRPKHLPSYENPPINEVTVGVQFAPQAGYRQIYALEIWQLFKKEFPHLEEHPPLPPIIETFGTHAIGQIGFGFIPGAVHQRFWFLSEKKDEIIQFQNDMFIHNWRKLADTSNKYPHFEEILAKYKDEITKLEEYFSKFSSDKLKINQCQLNYTNHILLSEEADYDKWLNIASFNSFEADEFGISYSKILKDESGKPFGRLICEANKGLNNKGEAIIWLNITYRGMPKDSNIESAMEFFKVGREMIVTCFDKITTDYAHKKWGKK